MSEAKCHIKQSATPHMWWGLPLGIRGATSRYPHSVLFAPVTRNAYGMELSVTRSKMPYHTRGGGTSWYPWGPPLGIHYRIRGFLPS